MTFAFADDDIVGSWAEVGPDARPPLVVLEPLLAFLEHEGLGAGPVEITPLGDGHSNVTLLLRRGDQELVLRRAPRPPVPPSAHDMLREARVVGALHGTAVPVPEILATCADESVIGVPFYVMRRLGGDAIGETLPASLNDDQQRPEIAAAMVRTLADIHAVDWREVGLDGLARPTGYLERQVRRFLGLWESNRTRDVPEVEAVGAWLADNLPTRSDTTVVHGDFRLGNLLVTPNPTRITGVLDWEMATLGDPLADLGFLVATWSEPQDPPSLFDLSPATRLPGFPSRRWLVEEYARASGRNVDDLAFYTTLALWKSVVFMENNYRRAIGGGSDDPFLLAFGDGVLELAARAHALGPGGVVLVD
ncbi:MAG: phosphotransferase family protein [Patulibacter sp.]